MMDAPSATDLEQLIDAHVSTTPPRRASGGVGGAWRYETNHGAIFVKCAPASLLDAFDAEATGLRELADVQALRVPEVRGVGVITGTALIAMEWIDFGHASTAAESRLGERLAAQHQQTAQRFGWHRDNTIGPTAQHNVLTVSWSEFYRDQRLLPQLEWAGQRGLDVNVITRGEQLCAHLDELFADHAPTPALLHGDLWSGNWSVDRHGQPVVFDPAVYYGDREVDLAMTRLFGGFGPAFYAAYEATWPLDADAAERVTLYNLYHVLNHFNLFGGSYAGQTARMIDQLLAKLRS